MAGEVYVTSDATGFFAFDALPAGPYIFAVLPPKGWRGAPDQAVTVPEDDTVTLADFVLSRKSQSPRKPLNVEIRIGTRR